MVFLTVGGAVMGTYQVITGQFHLPVKVITALGGQRAQGDGDLPQPQHLRHLHDERRPASARGPAQLPPTPCGSGCSSGCRSSSASPASWPHSAVPAGWPRRRGVMVILWLSGKLRYFFLLLFASILLVLGLKEFVPFAEYIFARFVSIFTLFEEFGTIGRTSSTARVYLAIASLHMFFDHPILGIGWDAFPPRLLRVRPPRLSPLELRQRAPHGGDHGPGRAGHRRVRGLRVVRRACLPSQHEALPGDAGPLPASRGHGPDRHLCRLSGQPVLQTATCPTTCSGSTSGCSFPCSESRPIHARHEGTGHLASLSRVILSGPGHLRSRAGYAP